MSITIYLQTKKSVKVIREKIRLCEISEVVSDDIDMEKRCKEIQIMDLTDKKSGYYTVSVLDLIKKIKSQLGEVEVNHIGEPQIVLHYKVQSKQIGICDYLKTLFICLIVFFGSGFSIMTFNIDVDTRALFSSLYEELTGIPSSGFTEIEFFYSIGIGIGAIFFFNHFDFRQKKKDPSALEVKMCLYENDVETTVVAQESKGSKGK